MSKPPKADKRTYIRCPFCSRQPVQVKRGRLVSHVTPGNLRCIAGGFDATQAQKINEQRGDPN